MELPRQIIFCVETQDTSGSDCIYINEILKYYCWVQIKKYGIKIHYIAMGGKHNYKSKKVTREIDTRLRLAPKSTRIIYVFDKDESCINPIDQRFIKDVTEYCALKKFDLVWFAKNIETVMLGHNSSNKSKDASEFRKKQLISQVETKLLKNPNPQSKKGSNILCVLKSILGLTKKSEK